MSFICKNGPQHYHDSVIQSKICWGLLAPAAPPPPVVAPTPTVRMVTPKQLSYINTLNGDLIYARKLTMQQASDYIDRLRKERKPAVSSDPRLDLIKGLIDMIPEGYYAVQPESGAHIDFLRISRPKRNKYAGTVKFQTQHGPSLDLAGVLWPSGSWSIYKHTLVDQLLLLVSDHHTASMRYASEIGRCMRCNAELTDDRSRHYGIGPECETKMGWGWVIPTVNERHGNQSFETLRNLGLINLTSR